MFSFLKAGARTEKREPAPQWVSVKGGHEFPLARHMARHEGYPLVDWAKLLAWTDTLAARRSGWTKARARRWCLRSSPASDARRCSSSSAPGGASARFALLLPGLGRIRRPSP